MDGLTQWIFAAVIEYENALLDALLALDDADEDAQLAARKRIFDAVVPFGMMSRDDRLEALRCLLRRRRISEESWDRIETAMKNLAAREPVH